MAGIDLTGRAIKVGSAQQKEIAKVSDFQQLRQIVDEKRPKPTGVQSVMGVPTGDDAITSVLKQVLKEQSFLEMFDQETMKSVEEAIKTREEMGVSAAPTMVDVTDTDQGQLTNPQPLFDMAREGDIQTEELEKVEPPEQPDPRRATSPRPVLRPESMEKPTQERTGAEAKLFDKIVGGESEDFNTIYYGSKIKTPKPLTEMTVGEIRAWQDESVAAGSKSSAVGRFQIIRKTMDSLIDSGVISEDDVFNEETQTKAYTSLLDRRGYTKIKTQIQATEDPDEKRKLAERLQNNLAMEFASIPVATAIPKGKFGKWPKTDLVAGDTFYKDPKNPNLNKAQHKSEDFLSILIGL